MKFCLFLAGALLFLFSCNDIDGKITVIEEFGLVDKDGRNVTIRAGTYDAEVEYDADANVVELEIDLGRRGEYDFVIPMPSYVTDDYEAGLFSSPQFEFEGMGIGDNTADVLITNKFLYRKGPYEARLRCLLPRNAGIYSYRPEIFFKVKRELSANVSIEQDGEVVAQFTGSETIKERDTVFLGECGEDMPEYEVHTER